MSSLTEFGRRLQIEALARALAGGAFKVVADDGRVLVECLFGKTFTVDSPDSFSFPPPEKVKAIAKGRAARFACYPQGERNAVIVGSIGGPTLAKTVDLVLEDTMIYEGMTFELEEFSHTRGAAK